ncbi:MAG: alcohol dehydrogenase catalytic domain-containing protein [Mycobacterium leprae]
MRLVLRADGLRIVLTPPQRPAGEHAVRVRIELAGLCRSDLKEIAGNRHGVSQFGHEVVGVVEESTLPRLPPGCRVSLDPNVPIERGTGFATTMWAAGSSDQLTTALPLVPHDVDARRLVFTEPLACARHCLSAMSRHLGRSVAGVRLAVLGAGTAGVLIAGLGQVAGAAVTLANRSDDRMSFLRERRLLDAPIARLAALPSASTEVAVVATSFVLSEVLREALRVVVPGGLVLLYGGTAPSDVLPGLDCSLDTVRRNETAVTADWHGKKVRVGGSYGTAPEDFDAVVRVLTELDAMTLPVERMITREVLLADLPQVLRQSSTQRFLGKTVVWPRRTTRKGALS